MAQEKRLLISNNNGSLSLAALARTAVSRYSGSLYIPNDANCFQDSAGTTAGAKDAVVGKLLDVVGTNHATQGTTGFKPFLRKGAKNLLRYSEQFDNGVWTKTRATINSNVATDPIGATTADKLTEDATATNTHNVYQTNASVTAGTIVGSVYAKAGERTHLAVQVGDGASRYTVVFDIQNGAFTTSATQNTPTGASYGVTSLGGGWYRVFVTKTYVSGTAFIDIGLSDSANPNFNVAAQAIYSGDNTSGAYIWGAQIETGSTASTYVATTSAPASNGIGPWWLDFDGTDDVLAAGAFGAGFASSTLVRSNYGAAQTTTTGQDLSAGYNMTVGNSGLIVVPDTVSAADLAVLQRYANSLGGYSA